MFKLIQFEFLMVLAVFFSTGCQANTYDKKNRETPPSQNEMTPMSTTENVPSLPSRDSYRDSQMSQRDSKKSSTKSNIKLEEYRQEHCDKSYVVPKNYKLKVIYRPR